MAVVQVYRNLQALVEQSPYRMVSQDGSYDSGWVQSHNLGSRYYTYIRYDFDVSEGETLSFEPKTVTFYIGHSMNDSNWVFHIDFYNGDPFNGGTIYSSASEQLEEIRSGNNYRYHTYQSLPITLSGKLYIRFWIDGGTLNIPSAQDRKSDSSCGAAVGLFITSPTVTPIEPINISKNGYQPITLRWSGTSGNGSLSNFIIEYLNSAGSYQRLISVSGSSTSYDAPAYKFPYGLATWRIKATNSYGVGSEWAYASFTSLQAVPSISSLVPDSWKYRKNSEPITFTWSAVNTYGTVGGSELEYDLGDGQGWRSLGSVDGAVQQYIVPANTFPSLSSIYWRVRSRNGENVWGDWVTGVFTTIDAITYAVPISPIKDAKCDETAQIDFTWYTSNSQGSNPSGADLRWRVDGGEWHSLEHVDGAVLRYTAPANTFPGDRIGWQVRAYNQDGVVSDWSNEVFFSTIDTPSVATAVSPIGTVEDADSPILFRWSTYSQSGEVSRGVDLQYSTDNLTWRNLGPSVESGPQIVGNVHEYEAPEHTIPPGAIYWRVRSYNRNMVAGDWSAAISFVARAAPTVQYIGVTTKPWAIVNWQSDDQLSYEVFVDGESLGSFFGGERQYQLPDYLSDGNHTVGVRVLGSFSLWSQIAEITVSIENSPESQLALKVMTDVDSELSWTGGSSDFYIYRDGLMIGHTNEHSFVDRTAVGVHDYLVVERLASGDYNASAVLTRTPSVDCQHIAALAGGEWIAIPHTLKSQSDPAYSESQEVEYNYLAGSDYPTASIGSQHSDSGSYSAVFLYTEQGEHKRFLALRGKPVIFKTADGEVMIGILHAWERKPKLSRNKKYYTAYTFSIQRVGWGDFIDDTV